MSTESAEEIRVRAICDHWVARLGLSFHPDNRGADYVDGDGGQFLTDDEVADYAEDMAALCRLAPNPYEAGLAAWRRAGLIAE